MRDYFQDGFDDGYGRYRIDDGDYPQIEENDNDDDDLIPF